MSKTKNERKTGPFRVIYLRSNTIVRLIDNSANNLIDTVWSYAIIY